MAQQGLCSVPAVHWCHAELTASSGCDLAL